MKYVKENEDDLKSPREKLALEEKYNIKGRQRTKETFIDIEDKTNKLRKIQAFASNEITFDDFEP